jgi:hypothetical protein
MSAAEDGFLIAFEFDDDDRPLIVEDDGRVCYAYVRGPWGNVVSDVWLYNRLAVPREHEWGNPAMSVCLKCPLVRLAEKPRGDPDGDNRYVRFVEAGPFANPTTHAWDWTEKPLPSYTEFSASISRSSIEPTAFGVFIRGEEFAMLRMGDSVGRSKLARKDGPLAMRFPKPGSVSWKAVEPYWQSVDIYSGADVFLRSFTAVPEPVGQLLAVTWCQSEVCNGGFHQFFMNSTGVLAPEAALGFRAINMPALAEMLEKAMAVLGTPYPREQEQRQRVLARLGEGADDDAEREWNPFYDLDDGFFAAIRNDLLSDAADEYASRSVPEGQVIPTPEPRSYGRVCYVRLGSP